MRRNRLSKFVEQKRKSPQKISEYNGNSFISKITKSLNESGYKLSRPFILSMFIVYLLVFFFIGYSLIAPMFFNPPQNASIENVLNNPKYDTLKSNLLKAGISKTNILNTFYSDLSKNSEVDSYFKNGTVLQNANAIANIIQKTAYKDIESMLGIQKDSLPPFTINVNSVYNYIQQDKTITNKKRAFLNTVRNSFLNYLSSPTISYKLIEIAHLKTQNMLFKFAFGIILLFQGLLFYFAFLDKPLQKMSLMRLKSQISPWLQMLTNSIQAGNSLSQALEFSQQKVSTAPLSNILKEITARYATYKNLEQALEPLNRWSDRIPELNNLISALTIQEKKGGNLIPVLYSINNLFSKRNFVMQKIESLASEATGQLKIIFVMFFFIILLVEIFMKSFRSPVSPVYMFFSRGGWTAGFINLTLIHLLIFGFSYALYKGGEVIVLKEMKL